MSDLKKAYFVGYKDGFRRAKAEMPQGHDERIEQIEKLRDEMNAEAQAYLHRRNEVVTSFRKERGGHIVSKGKEKYLWFVVLLWVFA